MDKLQYDSFYKFMVSAGVVLITAPLVGLYYLLCNDNQVLLSQEEYDALSSNSLQFLQQRDQTVFYLLRVLPWLLCTLIVIGLVCLLYGGIKWHSMQIELDEQTRLKTQEQRLNIKQLSSSEVVEKVAREIDDENNGESISSQTLKPKSSVLKVISIENQCYSYLIRKKSRSYVFHQNVKVGNMEYDIIATSKNNNIDMLYEVKYYSKETNGSSLNNTLSRLESMGPNYETIVHRNWKTILMIVTPDELYDKTARRYTSFFEDHSPSVRAIVLKESDLKE